HDGLYCSPACLRRDLLLLDPFAASANAAAAPRPPIPPPSPTPSYFSSALGIHLPPSPAATTAWQQQQPQRKQSLGNAASPAPAPRGLDLHFVPSPPQTPLLQFPAATAASVGSRSPSLYSAASASPPPPLLPTATAASLPCPSLPAFRNRPRRMLHGPTPPSPPPLSALSQLRLPVSPTVADGRKPVSTATPWAGL
ncbi:hypothetical protein HK405_000084, partial [Cladochytrium tenue]